MRTIDFDYHLPEELIADRPLPDRAASRMLVVHRDTGLIEHRHFHDILEYVQPGDHFVLNNTKVVQRRWYRTRTRRTRAGTGLEMPGAPWQKNEGGPHRAGGRCHRHRRKHR